MPVGAAECAYVVHHCYGCSFACSLLKASKAESSEEDRDSSAQQDVDREEHYSDAASSGEPCTRCDSTFT